MHSTAGGTWGKETPAPGRCRGGDGRGPTGVQGWGPAPRGVDFRYHPDPLMAEGARQEATGCAGRWVDPACPVPEDTCFLQGWHLLKGLGWSPGPLPGPSAPGRLSMASKPLHRRPRGLAMETCLGQQPNANQTPAAPHPSPLFICCPLFGGVTPPK